MNYEHLSRRGFANFSRRAFLQRSGLGLGSMALACLMNDDALLAASPAPAKERVYNDLRARPGHFPGQAKAVIQLWQDGRQDCRQPAEVAAEGLRSPPRSCRITKCVGCFNRNFFMGGAFMRMKFVLVLALFPAVTGLASAQQGFGGLQRLFQQPSVLALLEKVQKDIKLTDDQNKAIAAAGEKMREKALEAFSELQGLDREEREKKAPEIFKRVTEDLDKVVKETLKADQMKRLKQIGRQQAGSAAFQDEETQNALKLTKDQKDKLKEVGEETRKDFAGLRDVPREERAEKMREIRKKTLEKSMAVLTDEQKKTWKDLTGEPLEITQDDYRALIQR